MGTSEALLYLVGGRVEGASPSSGFERGSDLGDGYAGALAGGWCPTQYGQGVAIRQVREGFEGCRIIFAQRVADPVGVTHPGPDKVLMCPGQHLDAFRPGAVTGKPSSAILFHRDD